MAFGFLAKNDAGGVQIDGSYRNLSVREVNTVTLEDSNSGTTVNFGQHYVEPVLLAYQPANPAGLLQTINTDSNGKYEGFDGSSTLSEGNTQLTYVVLTEEPVAPNSGFGIVVFDSNGNPVYDSAASFPRIVGVTSSSSFGHFTVNDADNNFFMMHPTSWASGYQPQIDISNMYVTGIRYVDSTTVDVDYYIYGQIPGDQDAKILTTPWTMIEFAL